MNYEKLFDSLGTSVRGKILAATIIGASAGLAAARKVTGNGQVGWWWAAGGGAAVGLVAGLILGVAEVRSKRIAAGTSKPLSIKGQLAVVAGTIAALFAVCLVIVFGPSFQLGSTTPRLRPEFEMQEAGAPEDERPHLPDRNATPELAQGEPAIQKQAVLPIDPALVAASDKPPPLSSDPKIATVPAPNLPLLPPPSTPTTPMVEDKPLAKPAPPLPVQPAFTATMQSVAGKWKLNKTLTATLLADGSLKTNYPAIRNGKWTLSDGGTVTIHTSKGVAVYTFKLDAKGTAGSGNWKDGSKASPVKTD